MELLSTPVIISGCIFALVVVYVVIRPFFDREKSAEESIEAAFKPSKRPPTVSKRDFTIQELAYYDGTEDRPIYIAADGFVFDVSSGRDFYGPGAGYHPFAGRFVRREELLLYTPFEDGHWPVCSDSSIGLGTVVVDTTHPTKKTVADLSVAEQGVLRDWVSKYVQKYPLVGYLTEGTQPRSVKQAEKQGY